MNADQLINEYSRLSEERQKEFDRRYKGLKSFAKRLAKVVKVVNEQSEIDKEKAIGTPLSELRTRFDNLKL